MILGVAPFSVGIAIAVFVITVVVSRYVSLASIFGAIAVGVAVWFDPKLDNAIVQSVLSLMALLVVWLHRANVKRLLNGTENRFGKKKEEAL
jgi:glycerol-3-phosphate acyltransferase PlsY